MLLFASLRDLGNVAVVGFERLVQNGMIGNE